VISWAGAGRKSAAPKGNRSSSHLARLNRRKREPAQELNEWRIFAMKEDAIEKHEY